MSENSILSNVGAFVDEKLGETCLLCKSSKEVDMERREVIKNRFYAVLQEQGYNLGELQEILECTSTMLIMSGAGSGKTTALILKILYDFLMGDMLETKEINGVLITVPARILVCTFLKTGAEELKRAFDEWCMKLNVVGINSNYLTFKTIHAEVYDALKKMGVPLNIAEDTKDILKRIMNKYGVHSVMSTGRALTNDEVSDMECIISYARNRLDAQRYNHPLMGEYTIDTIKLEAMLKEFKQYKMIQGQQDFEDLQEMLLEGANINPNVRGTIQQRYDYVFVDEFQDTSQLQYELLKYYFAGAKRILCIGDDDQCIYSWRGSDIDIISTRFAADYTPVIKNLTTNYRCSKNILNAVIPSIEKNTVRMKKDLKGYREGGEVHIVVDGSVNMLLNAIKVDLAKGETVGVIARTNQDLLIPAILLELDDVDIDFGLSKSVNMDGRLAKQVLGMMDLVTKRYTREFPAHLKTFLSKYRSFEADKLCEVLNVNKDKSLFTLPLGDIQHSAPTLFPLISNLRLAYKVSEKQAYLNILDRLLQEVYTGKTIYAQRARDFVYYIRKIIEEHTMLEGMTLAMIEEMICTEVAGKLDRRKKKKEGGNSFIKLTTVHEAKGKEWDNVYIWNDVIGSFPSSVGNRELTKSEYEEERRVHYIAWTRPKKKLTVYTRSARIGEFLNECDLSGEGVTVEEVRGVEGECSKLQGEKQVFQKKVEILEDSFDVVLDNYYKKYFSFDWIAKTEGVNLDICDMMLGGKANVKEELEKRGVSKYPLGMQEQGITDAITALVIIKGK